MKPIFQRYHSDETLRLNSKELAADYGKGNFIFLGSSADGFASAIPIEWILSIYDKCGLYDENRYLFQSKKP